MKNRLNTRQMVKVFYRSWWRRPFWLLAALVVPLIAGRIMLTPLAKTTVRHHLDGLRDKGQVTFGDLDIFLFPLSFNFQDVKVRGTGGDMMEVDRVEVHAARLQDLVGDTPQVRVRLLRPRVHLHPGAGDLEQLARALPTSRIEVTTVENGSLANTFNAEGLPVLTALGGDIEGLATGSETGRRGWKIWMDGRWSVNNPVHALVQSQADGAWRGSMTAQQLTAPAGAGNPSMAIDARLQGMHERVNGAVQVTWTGDAPPVDLAQATLRGLSSKWPGGTLVSQEVRRNSSGEGPGQSVTVVLARDSSKATDAAFHAFDCVGMFLDVLVRANEAVLPPPAGMAAVLGAPTEQAVEAP